MIRWMPEVATADQAALLAAVAALRAGTTLPGMEVVSRRLLRCVARVPLTGRFAAFVKLHRLPRRTDRLRYAFRRLPGVAELDALVALRRAGIACPRPLAAAASRGPWGVPQESWLATEEVPAGTPAVAAWEALLVAEQLAGHGWFHPDLHPANFLRARSGEVVLLDLQSVRRRAGAAQLAAMRARCLLGFAQRDGIALLALAEELVSRGRIPPAAVPELVQAAARIHVRWLLSRARRPWVESSEFTGSGLWVRTWRRRDCALPQELGAGLGRAAVAGVPCAAARTSEPGVLAVTGPAALRQAWPGDAWQALTAGAAPRLLGCRRLGPLPWSRTVLFLRADESEWPGAIAAALEGATHVRTLARAHRRGEPSPCVTLPLRAGYNPAPSFPAAHCARPILWKPETE